MLKFSVYFNRRVFVMANAQADLNLRWAHISGVTFSDVAAPLIILQSSLNGSNIFRTIEICSRYGKLEPLRVNHAARSGSKWR